MGIATAARRWLARRGAVSWWRLEYGVLLVAVLIPLVVLLQAVSIQSGVPDYVHDGAHHVETIDSLRQGVPLTGLGWYPTGFHAPVAALLSLVPAIDSATGGVDWAAALTILAPLAVFGFGMALWRDERVAAAGALLLAITYNYPYEPHLYSVWPNAAGLLLVVGIWTAALEYLRKPTLRMALLGSILAAGLLLTHGTELYTAAIGMVAFVCWRPRLLASKLVTLQLVVASVVAAVFVMPYIWALAGWASVGGAVAVGTDYFPVRHGAGVDNLLQEASLWSSGVSSGLLLDLPFRLGLLGAGVWLARRYPTGKALVCLCGGFIALVAVFRYVDAEPVRMQSP
jgi:hypothetical protein